MSKYPFGNQYGLKANSNGKEFEILLNKISAVVAKKKSSEIYDIKFAKNVTFFLESIQRKISHQNSSEDDALQLALNNILEQHKKIYDYAISIGEVNLRNDSQSLGASYYQSVALGEEFEQIISKENLHLLN